MIECPNLQFEDKALFGLEKLSLLYVFNSQLKNAPKIDWVGSSLVNLDLSNNMIKALPENYFINCSAPEKVRLDNNQLTAVPELLSITSTLKRLYLE